MPTSSGIWRYGGNYYFMGPMLLFFTKKAIFFTSECSNKIYTVEKLRI